MSSLRPLALLGLASALSGFAAVAFEVLWIRRLGDLFGHAVLSMQVVLAIFFLGLGLGAWIGGRLADRRDGAIGLYVFLEVVIALSGLAFLPACSLLEGMWFSLTPAEWSLAGSLAAKGGISMVLLAVPTVAMGATLPALVRHVVGRSDQLATRLGWLYGTNTLGAAGAALITVMVILPEAGLTVGVRWIAAANFAAIAAALLGRLPVTRATQEIAAPARDESASVPEAARDRWILAGAATVSGFVAVGLEVCWTRALAARFLSTVYSFAVLLAAFLFALGIGALVVGFLERARLVTRRTLALVMIGSGFAALASMAMLAQVPDLAGTGGGGWLALQRRELLFALAVMAPALLFFGVNLPLVVRLAHREVKSVGREIGRVWLANTVGSVAAPLVIGFLVLPELGLRWTIVLLAGIALLYGTLVLSPWTGSTMLRRTRLRFLVLAAAAVFFLPGDLRHWRSDESDRLVWYREGLMASVAVVDTAAGDRILKLNHDYELGTRRTRFAQARQGVIPLLLHGEAKSALSIGLGTGSTAGAMASYGVERLDIVEIVPELGETLPLFAEANHRLADYLAREPAARLFATDARAFVRGTGRRYDVIVGDLFVPWRAGEGAMYTREHFAHVRARLEEGGLFCQWLPLYQLRDEELRTILATFLEVFPASEMWWLYFNVEQPVVGLVGRLDDTPLDLDALAARLVDPARAEGLARDGLDGFGPLAGSWIAGAETLRAWAGDTAPETEARPRIEFLAPRRHLARETSAASENLPEVLARGRGLEGGAVTGSAERIADAAAHQRALGGLFRALLRLHETGDVGGALDELEGAVGETPRWGWLVWNLEQVAEQVLAARDEARITRVARTLDNHRETRYLARYLEARLALARGDRADARDLAGQALSEEPAHEASRRLFDSL